MDRRLYTLDAMRGIAAIAVFTGHARAFISPFVADRSELAVDFFFMLSGYVLARSYGAKLASEMPIGKFLFLRYVRLYPLYFLSILLAIFSGGLALISGKGDLSAYGFTIATVTGLLLFPSPTWFDTERTMPLNPPSWSLFFELIANIILAIICKHAKRYHIIIIVIVSILGMLASIALTKDFVGGFYWSNFAVGLPRVCFSFFLGVLIFDILPDKQLKSRLAWLLPLALVGLLCVRVQPALWFDLFFVVFICPLLIVLGAVVQPKASAAFASLGDLSYPLYVLHMPILMLFWRVFHVAHTTPEAQAPVGGVAIGVGLVAICLILDRLYDRPVRRWIMSSVERKRPIAPLDRAGAPELSLLRSTNQD